MLVLKPGSQEVWDVIKSLDLGQDKSPYQERSEQDSSYFCSVILFQNTYFTRSLMVIL